MSYTVLSFNVQKMGNGAVEQRKKDWRLIARMIKYSGADLVSLQEILSEKPVEELCRNLNMYGGRWESSFEQKDTVRNCREGYAFLWNTKRVSLLIANGKTYKPHIETKWSRSLIRPPYVARFMPVAPMSPFIEIRLTNTHIIFAEDKYSREKNSSVFDSDYQMRINEYRKLSKEVFPDIAWKGSPRTSYTFITGDYNIHLWDCFLIDSLPASGRLKMSSRQPDKSTISNPGSGENNMKKSFGYANDYDHFSFSMRESSYVASAHRIDAPEIFCSGDFRYYREKVSDHVPVILKIDLRHSSQTSNN